MMRSQKAGRLTVEVFEDREMLGKQAAKDAVDHLNKVIREKGSCRAIFAAAPSQNEFLKELSQSGIDWSKVHAFHMDEYIGLDKDHSAGFGNFLRDHLFDLVPLGSADYINISAQKLKEDADGNPVEKEIERYSRLISKQAIDVVFMGIGENGHIAFNDPAFSHFDDERIMQRVRLDETCRMQQVHDGCFRSIEEVPTEALTLTVPALFSATRLFCMVPAKTKAWAVEQTVLGEIKEAVPASILRMHPQATLYVDRESGSNLISRGFVKSL